MTDGVHYNITYIESDDTLEDTVIVSDKTVTRWEIKKLSKEKNQEVSWFKLVETIKTTKKITKVETSLCFVLLILNATVLAAWYLSDIPVVTFLIYYILFGGLLNVASIIIHNKWENKYINDRASFINTEVSLIKMNYDAKIKKLLDDLDDEET